MSFQQGIREILRTSTDLVDLVGDRIRPDQLDEADTLPALIVELETLDALDTLDDAAGNENELSFAVACCGVSRTAATELETLVRETLDGYRGTVAGYAWRPITFTSTVYDQEPSEDGSDDDDWFINDVKFDAFVEQL